MSSTPAPNVHDRTAIPDANLPRPEVGRSRGSPGAVQRDFRDGSGRLKPVHSGPLRSDRTAVASQTGCTVPQPGSTEVCRVWPRAYCGTGRNPRWVLLLIIHA